MLIPSIDLMAGKIVQLVQGERKALEFDDFSVWVERFRKYPMVQVIDLDAAMGRGNNRPLVEHLCAELPCQVGGGLRTVEAAALPLSWGARKVIIGSALFNADGANLSFTRQLTLQLKPEQLIFAVDSRGGFVAVKGWIESTGMRPAEAMRALEPFCSAFLYTHIDTEGLLEGFPFEALDDLRAATEKKLIVAGGINSADQVERLDRLGIDAVVGMAIYTGMMPA